MAQQPQIIKDATDAVASVVGIGAGAVAIINQSSRI